MRLALTALALGAVDAFMMPSSKKCSALRATGDRWYCGEGVKYPRGAAGMPPSPPAETGGYSHEPQLFDFWADTNYDYEVALARPLGIVFEEIGTAAQPRGVKVIDVGGNAAASGKVSVGDVLVGVTAVRYIGGEYLGKARPERDIFPAGQMDFDTVVDAISSNEEPELSELRVVPHSSDVILRMRFVWGHNCATAYTGSMKVAPAVAEVLGVVDAAAGRTEGYGEVLSVAHAPPAEEATAPRPAEMERGPAAADEVQPGAGGARGSVEFLGRWNEKYRHNERAMPVKMEVEEDTVRLAFSKFVDELVQNGAPSGTFVMTSSTSAFSILRRGGPWRYVSWSASPEDKSYQRHGFVGMAPQGIIDSRLVLVRQGSPNVLRFDHWQALQAGGAAPLTCHASNPGNGGIGKMYPEERRFWGGRYTESKCVAARDACSVQLVQGKFLKRVDADLVLEAGNREGTGVSWVGGESDEETYTAGTWGYGREWEVNEDGSISLVIDPVVNVHPELHRDLVLGVDSGVESDQHKNIRFADFEGVVDDFGASLQMAAYRVTLPRGGFRGKWAGRPPPLAPEDLHTGPRSDGLLSTDEISGRYSAACSCTPAPTICPSMTVVPLGADAIETFRSGCTTVIPILVTCPLVEGGVQIRVPGTNKFRHWQEQRFAGDEEGVTFSANGMAKQGCCCFKKRPHSQKRTFQKVDAGDLAGTWCGCTCFPIFPLWPFSPFFLTRKRALNQDQYEECGLCCSLGLPLPCPVDSTTRTRIYVNGHPTNVFTLDDDGSDQARNPQEDRWYRDSSYAYGTAFAHPHFPYCSTKCC